MSARHTIATLLAWVLVVIACRADPATARGTAERFLDAHYVLIDLDAALPFTSGLARQKVEREQELVRGQTIDDTTRKPIVRYRFLEEHPQPDGGVQFVYQGKILVDGADPLAPRWLVTVRPGEGGFRVTNYQEILQ